MAKLNAPEVATLLVRASLNASRRLFVLVNEGRLHEATAVRYKLPKLVPRFANGIKNAFRVYGPLGAAAYVFDHFRVTRAERAESFDQRFGTLTEGQVYPWQLTHCALTPASGCILMRQRQLGWCDAR